jgi:integrase
MMRPMTKKSQIQPVKGIRGVRIVVFCNKCKREITANICPPSNIDVKKCPFSKTHQVLKGYVHVPGSKNARKTFYVKSGNIDDAIRIGLNLKEELKTSQDMPVPVVKKSVVVNHVNKKVEQTKLLKYAMAEFMGWLNNENVPSHLQRPRSQQHLNDISRGLKFLMGSLKENGYNPDSFRVDELNDNIVGLVNDYLLNQKKFGNRSFNKHMGYYTSFMSWLDEHGHEGIKNYFKKVQHKRTIYNPETITKEEFEQLFQKITKENETYKNSEQTKTKRSFYRSWLADGFRLAIETGRRRPELVSMKWADVHVSDSVPIYIKVEDSKVNNILNLKDSEKKYVYVPVSKGLHELLIKMGFENYMKGENKDAYILAPEITDNKRKERMSNTLSYGFAQYYAQLNNEKPLHFGCFRKTYLTGISIHTSGNAQLVSGHSSDGAVLNKHYIDPKAVASVMAAKGFEVFPKEKEISRKEELKDLRKKKVAPEKSIER